jgi:predicted TIM-barrel fold metal-dependent hydrolase
LVRLPLPSVAAALRELDRIIDVPAVRGVSIVAQTTLYQPEQIGLEEVLARCADAGLAVVLHPTAGAADISDLFEPFGLVSALHTMVTSSLVAAKLVLSGALDRLPALDLVLTQFGGVLPFLTERLDKRGRGAAEKPFGAYLRERLYYDCSDHSPGPTLSYALATLGAERVMIGSDWPSRPIEPAIAAIRETDLSDAEREWVLGGTAQRWFDPARRRRG